MIGRPYHMQVCRLLSVFNWNMQKECSIMVWRCFLFIIIEVSLNDGWKGSVLRQLRQILPVQIRSSEIVACWIYCNNCLGLQTNNFLSRM
jgi:hypothetical protein